MAKFAASPSLATLLYTFPIRQRSIRLATLPILLAHSDVVKLLVKKKWMHFEARLLSMKLMVSLHLISSIKKSERRRVLLWHLIPESPYSASLLCRRQMPRLKCCRRNVCSIHSDSQRRSHASSSSLRAKKQLE